MDKAMLEDQRTLVAMIEAEGWEVTGAELTSYDSPWTDEDAPEAEITLTARKPYGDADEEAGDDDNPYRLK